jgi:hypothetical protein
MRSLIVLGLAALVTVVGCAGNTEDDASSSDEALSHGFDTIDQPTDMHLTLAPGVWHDDTLTVKSGWHLYKYTPAETGVVAFQMRADPALSHHGLWTYLRIVDAANHNEVWAAVANRDTNLTDVLVAVQAGRTYQVVATTQDNSTANDLNKPNVSAGNYTVAAIPQTVSF